MKNVFISSTSKDLQIYRTQVKGAVERLGLRAIDMKNFGSRDGDAARVSVEEVGNAHLFIGIIANRYGHIPAGMSQSITELEYNEATRRKIPRLMYLIDEDYLATLPENDPLKTYGGDHPQKLASFKARINEVRVRSLFTSPDNLAHQVSTDLGRTITEMQAWGRFALAGWGFALVSFLIAVILLINVMRPDNRGNIHNSFFNGIPTPLEGEPSDGEPVVVVANFERDNRGVADLLGEAIEAETDVRVVRVSYPITGTFELSPREQAVEIGDTYNASLVIWGAVSDGGVRYSFETTTPSYLSVEAPVDDLSVTFSELDDVENFIFRGMDSIYIVELILGQIYQASLNYEDAITSYTSAIARIPAGRETELGLEKLYYYRGNTYRAQRKYEAAIADYQEAIKWGYAKPSVYNNLGLAYYGMKDYDQAIASYTQAIELDSDYETAYNNRGNVYYAQSEYEQAIVEYTLAVEADDDYETAYRNRGLAYAAMGNYEQAIVEYTLAIEADDDYEEAYNSRGVAYAALEDYDRAIAEYTLAIEEDKRYEEAYRNRGNAYLKQARYGEALADFTEALDIDDEYADAYNDRGRTYYIQGLYEQAIADYTLAIEADEEYMHGYFNRGLAHAAQGQDEEAIADYSRAIEIDENYVDAYFYRANIYYSQKNFEDAITDYDRVIALDEAYIDAYNNRGNAQLALGRFDQAIESYTLALEIGGDLPYVYFNRGNTYGATRQFTSALEDYTLAIEGDSAYEEAYAQRGFVYYYLEDYENALSDVGRALTINPEYVPAYSLRATIYIALEEYDAAQADFEQLIAMGHDEGLLGLGILYQAQGDTLDSADSFFSYLQRETVESVDEGVFKNLSRIRMSENRAFVFDIHLEAEQIITLTARSVQPGQVDSLIVLVDPAGVAIAGGDDQSQVDLDAQISAFNVPTTGLYTLWVSHAGGGRDGLVEVIFELDNQE